MQYWLARLVIEKSIKSAATAAHTNVQKRVHSIRHILSFFNKKYAVLANVAIMCAFVILYNNAEDIQSLFLIRNEENEKNFFSTQCWVVSLLLGVIFVAWNKEM